MCLIQQVVCKEYLKNIRQISKGLTAYCNAGKTYTNKKGNLGDLEVWLNILAIANILLFTELEKLYCIMYDTVDMGGEFVLHTPKEEVCFKQNKLGLPYISLSDNNEAVCLLNIIKDNLQGHTKRQVKEATEA